MPEGGEKTVPNSMVNMSEKHKKIFVGGYLGVMAAILLSGIIANFFHEKSNSK